MSTPVTLQGRLTADPELRFSNDGKPVARFSVVTSRRYKDRSGEWAETDTSFWDCTAFGRLAEGVAENLRKGSLVIVAGRMVMRDWEDKQGNKRRSFNVTVDDAGPSLKFFEGSQGASAPPRSDSRRPARASAAAYDDSEPPF